MYQSDIRIKKGAIPSEFYIEDHSTGDELISERHVTLRDGDGKLTSYEFDETNKIKVSGLTKDKAYTLSYSSVTSTPTFGSTYTFNLVFITTGFSEDLLLDYASKIHCGTQCKDHKDVEKANKILFALNAAELHAKNCSTADAQKVLDWINDLRPYMSKEGGCGCS